MQTLKRFLKRNAPVFIFGLIIAIVFLLIILTQPKDDNRTPFDFKRVEEEVFEREPKEPEPTEYALQIPSPENKGKPYFYGEYDPYLRDDKGYPVPPAVGTTPRDKLATEQEVYEITDIEYQERKRRLQPINITFTDKGFGPVDATGFTGGKITWTNNTDKEIRIVQTLPIHDALKGGIVIKPGESFEFRPLINKQITYMDEYSRKYGTLMVIDSTRPLVELIGE